MLNKEDSDSSFLSDDDLNISTSVHDFSYPELSLEEAGLADFIKCAKALRKKVILGIIKCFMNKHERKIMNEVHHDLQLDANKGQVLYDKYIKRPQNWKDMMDNPNLGKRFKKAMTTRMDKLKVEFESGVKKDTTPWPKKTTDTTTSAKILPWAIFSGLGSNLFSEKAKANSLNTCPLQCPTFTQVKKVSKEIEQAKKDYKTSNDFEKCMGKIKPLLEIKSKYNQCQSLNCYK